MDAGTMGGIAGTVLGVIGGAVGTYFSVTRTNGPRERAFVVKAAIVTWLLVIAFLLGLILLPRPYNFLLWIPYGIGIGLGIRWWNRHQFRIRTEEAGR
jgi:hypothetical protein